MKNYLLSIIFSFFTLFFNIFAQNNQTYLKFSETKNKDEFKCEVYIKFPDSLFLDLNNSHLSFTDNKFDSIDKGEWIILKFVKSNLKFEVIFLCENSQPPKFVKLQLVFLNEFGEILLPTKTEYCKLILEDNFRIMSENAALNSYYIYFNNSKMRNGAVFDMGGKNICNLENINSGDLVDFGWLRPGMYVIKFFDINMAEKINIY